MAPEMLQGKKYDYSVDRWAVGILTFELLCGIGPFSAGSTEDTEYYIQNFDIK